jgi:diguanylate cyclase (GGDEF)-like protein
VSSLLEQAEILRLAWLRYKAYPTFTHFVEFSSLLNHFADTLNDKSQAGLLYACRYLEQKVLSFFGGEESHPIPNEELADLDRRVARLGELMRYYTQAESSQQNERRVTELRVTQPKMERQPAATHTASRAPKVYMLGGSMPAGANSLWSSLVAQLAYFGVKAQQSGWDLPTDADSALGVSLVDMSNMILPERVAFLKELRAQSPMARIVCLNMPDDFMFILRALQAGVNRCLLSGEAALQKILDLILGQNNDAEPERYRVLVVDDSQTAAYAIRRSLEEHEIVVENLRDPSLILQAIRSFQPDLILMDMYMPNCTGVEAVQVIRQYDEFLSIPVVYLSGETNVGLQVAALRLGGDQFLTKPHNPVLMNAIIRSKIDRYRMLRHSMQTDSLTGLLNHISSKQALAKVLEQLPSDHCLDVVMLDIDHFKSVNDTYGHPVGDQVIRSLAWLLKQRLRQYDIVGRYGGEEFVLGLVGRVPGSARDVLNRIREDFRQISFNGASGEIFTVSFSAGLASQRAGAPGHLDSLLETADNALYEAKHSGRNCIVLKI